MFLFYIIFWGKPFCLSLFTCREVENSPAANDVKKGTQKTLTERMDAVFLSCHSGLDPESSSERVVI